jgi:hypothetical protein
MLPTRLLESYDLAFNDSEILALRHELAVCDARIGDLLGRVDTGEAGSLWRNLRESYSDLLAANASGDMGQAATALNDIGRLIGRGQSDYAAWHEVLIVIEQRRRLAESEQKRLVAMKAMIPSERAAVLFTRIGSAIKTIVKDEGERRALAREFRVIVMQSEEMAMTMSQEESNREA